MTKRDEALTRHAAEDNRVDALAKAGRQINDQLAALSPETRPGERPLPQAGASSARVLAVLQRTPLRRG